MHHTQLGWLYAQNCKIAILGSILHVRLPAQWWPQHQQPRNA